MHHDDNNNTTLKPDDPNCSMPVPDAADTTTDKPIQSEPTSSPITPDTPETDQVEKLRTELTDMREKLLRTLAEAENTRKRAERQLRETRIYAVEALACDLLPVTDDLDRALTATSVDQHQALIDGVGLVRKALQTVLERHGVTPIQANIGSVFDPSVHQAVSQIPSEQPKGHIASTFTPGWKIGERPLRAAMVAVSSGISQDGPVANPDNTADSPTFSKPGDIVDTSA